MALDPSTLALDANTLQDLIKQLIAGREELANNIKKTNDLLLQALAASNSLPISTKSIDSPTCRHTSATLDVESVKKNSVLSGDTYSSDDDDGGSLYVQEPLEEENYTENGFREHLKNYAWTSAGRRILDNVMDDDAISSRECIFPTELGPTADRSHYTHYSLFDVGADGAPLAINAASDIPTSRAVKIWNILKSTNADGSKERKAVGRLITVREPSPLLFGALHYTMGKHFDMDELFGFLVDDGPAQALPHRAFNSDPRHRSTFIFTLEYFTVVGVDCVPMKWQRSDEGNGKSETHIPISRCSSVVALALEGRPMSTTKNKDRRNENTYGEIYDPFSPWRVLNIQAYPDWKSTVDIHQSSYVCGPEAFLRTVQTELHDARKRLMECYERISDLVDAPANFLFHSDIRDRLLFEDDSFTCSRRYFWAYMSLGIMNQDIHEIITTYRETFQDSVWLGTNRIIWPGEESTSSRHAFWRKRMAALRRDLDYEISKLEEVAVLNDKKRVEVVGLRENLFSGTSVLESRRSVQQAEIAVDQGRNIRLLTLITIFFLPLTFVTSVFGMTNMPQNDNFNHFAWTTIAVCVPTYLLTAFLVPNRGHHWWADQQRAARSWTSYFLSGLFDFSEERPKWSESFKQDNPFDLSPATPKKKKIRNRMKSDQKAQLIRSISANMPELSPHQTSKPKRSLGSSAPLSPSISPLDRNLVRQEANRKEDVLGPLPEQRHRPSSQVRFHSCKKQQNTHAPYTLPIQFPPLDVPPTAALRSRPTMSFEDATSGTSSDESGIRSRASVSSSFIGRVLGKKQRKATMLAMQKRRNASNPV